MIQLAAVSKMFQSGRGLIRALRDISYCLEAGKFAAVTGKSGSGKSTLLNCIGGLEHPDKGDIICFGTPLHALAPRQLSLFQRRQVGFVFQQGNLLSYLTVAENIGFPLILNRLERGSRLKRIAELLERIDLVSAAKALPQELSGGETQRVALARAIAHNPKILLADEPTASLDTATGLQVVQLMREMGRDNGCTVIMATHDMEITTSADAIILLKDGCIQKEDDCRA